MAENISNLYGIGPMAEPLKMFVLILLELIKLNTFISVQLTITSSWFQGVKRSVRTHVRMEYSWRTSRYSFWSLAQLSSSQQVLAFWSRPHLCHADVHVADGKWNGCLDIQHVSIKTLLYFYLSSQLRLYKIFSVAVGEGDNFGILILRWERDSCVTVSWWQLVIQELSEFKLI